MTPSRPTGAPRRASVLSYLFCLTTAGLLAVSAFPSSLAAASTEPDGRSVPAFVGGNFVAMSGGASHTCAIATDGFAHCWGEAAEGRLGNGQFGGRESRPVRVLTSVRFDEVAAGWDFTCARSGSGEVWCWGANWSGQLGDGTYQSSATPVRANLPEPAADLTVGHRHACAVGASGTVYCWGGNHEGQLGDGSTSDRGEPAPVAGGLGFSQIYSSAGAVCALTDVPGDLYCWGANWGGQLGDGTYTSRSVPTRVSGATSWRALPADGLGQGSMCALDSANGLWCWGVSWWGQTGGNPDTNVPTPVSGAPTFVELSAAEDSYCGLDAGGVLYCWGRNDVGQSGIGSLDSDHVARQVTGEWGRVFGGQYHRCALSGDDGYCWGADRVGQLGIGTVLGSPTPSAIIGGTGITQPVAGAADNGCGLNTSSGAVYCWGNGSVTQGVRSEATLVTSPVPMVFSLTVGDHHACAIDGAGEAYCWGGNWDGVLGDGTYEYRGQATRVTGGHTWNKVSAGAWHTCGVASTGEAYCWGAGHDGVLGDANLDGHNIPTQVVKPSGVLGWLDIEAGQWITCAIADVDPNSGLPERSGYCWGQNFWGGLGLGHDDQSSPYATPQLVLGGHSWRSLAVGYESTVCGSDLDNTAWCWGRGDLGQLGRGTTATYSSPQLVGGGLTLAFSGSAVAAIDVGQLHVCARDASNAVLCWGANPHGQLGDGSFSNASSPTSSGVSSAFHLSVGRDHACAFDGTPKCWGFIGLGSLGNGQLAIQDRPQMLDPLAATNVLAIGDSVQADIEGGETDSYLIDLAVGDTIDAGVFAVPASGLGPRISFFEPDGTFRRSWTRTRAGDNEAAILTGEIIDQDGLWRIDVSSYNGSTGAYVLRTRHAGPVIVTEPFSLIATAQKDGGSAHDEPFYVRNFSYGSAEYTLSLDAVGLSVNPTGGTLNPRVDAGPSGEAGVGGGALPALEGADGSPVGAPALTHPGSNEHTLTFDPSGLARGEHWTELTAETQSDPWAGPHVTALVARVFDPAIDVLARNRNGTTWPVLVEDDGTVLVGDLLGVNRYDPADGSFHQVWDVAGSGHSFFVSGLARRSDGRLFASVNNGFKVVELHPDGSVSEYHTFHMPARALVAVGNDLYVNHNDVLVRLDATGNRTEFGRHPSSSARSWANAYDVAAGKIYVADSGSRAIYAFDLATERWDTEAVAVLSTHTIWGMTVAESGAIYVGTVGDSDAPQVARLQAGTLAFEDLGFAPDYVLGLDLTDGALYFAADEWGLATMAVPDSPQRAPLVALGDSVAGTLTQGGAVEYEMELEAGQVVDIGAFNTDLTTSLYPRVEVTTPDGTRHFSWARRFWCDQEACTPFAGQVLPAFQAPESGRYGVRVFPGFGSGPFVLKTRPVGDLMTFDGQGLVQLNLVAGAGPVADTMYLYNTGPGATSFQIHPSHSFISVTPSSGTLPAGTNASATVSGPQTESAGTAETPGVRVVSDAALAPADAIAIVVSIDPSGLPEGTEIRPDTIGFTWETPADRSFRDGSMGVYANVISSDFVELFGDVGYRTWGIDVLPDGRLAHTTNAALELVDPETGAREVVAAELDDQPWGLSAVDLGPDGYYYVGNFRAAQVLQITPDGSVLGVFHANSPVRDVSAAPDGTVYVATADQIAHLGLHGNLAEIVGAPAAGQYRAVGWDPVDERLFYALEDQLWYIDPVDGPVHLATPGIGGIRSIDAGRDYLWLRGLDHLAQMSRDGSVLDVRPAPYGLGGTLADGEYYLTAIRRFDRAREQIWRVAVPDTPPGSAVALALGDSVVARLGSSADEESFALQLQEGEEIDIGVFATDLSSGFYPTARIVDPNGNPTGAPHRRFGCDGSTCTPFAGRLLAAYEAPSTGLYTVVVRSIVGAGEFVLRARRAGGLIVTERDISLELTSEAGSGALDTDTVYVFNSGPSAIDFELGVSHPSLLTVTPSSGTALPAAGPVGVAGASASSVSTGLVGLEGPGQGGPGATGLGIATDPAAAPANAIAIVVTFNPGSLPVNALGMPDSVGFSIRTPSDPSFRDMSLGVRYRVYDAAFDVVARALPARAWGVGVEADGKLAVAADGSVLRLDPSGGAHTRRVSGLSSPLGLSGLAVHPVTGDVYVGDLAADVVRRVRADNSSSVAFEAGTDVRDVDVSPDGTIWMTLLNRVVRLTPDGTATNLATGGSHGGVEFDHVNRVLYYSDGGALKRWKESDGSIATVVDGLFFPHAIEIGRSGHLYVRAFLTLYEIDASEGSIVNEWIVPMSGTGLALGEGALYGTGMRRQVAGTVTDWVWKLPVQDGPQGLGTRPIVVWAEDVVASRGDTVQVAVSIDMSQHGGSVGSFSARMTFDTAVVKFVSMSTEFVGSYNPNTDSTSTGVVRFGGLNTNATENLDTTRLALIKFEAKGPWGSETVLDLDIPEVSTPSFQVVTSQMDVFNGSVLVSPGTYRVAMRGATSVSKEESKSMVLRVYLGELKAGIGSVQGRIVFDNSVLLVDSLTAGNYGGSFDSNKAMQADSGFVRFAVVQITPPAVDSATFVTVWARAQPGSSGGDSTTVHAIIEEVGDVVQFTNLLPFLVANDPLRVGVTVGIWGDPNKDKKITALDALVCLSAVVGKDVSAFDATACDVAPDSGSQFIGRVTALDALAILSHVVGKSLPPTFRVGSNR